MEFYKKWWFWIVLVVVIIAIFLLILRSNVKTGLLDYNDPGCGYIASEEAKFCPTLKTEEECLNYASFSGGNLIPGIEDNPYGGYCSWDEVLNNCDGTIGGCD